MYARRVAVGPDYFNAMNYVVGQEMIPGWKIHLIERSDMVRIFIKNNLDEVVLWKEITLTTPMHVEYNINF